MIISVVSILSSLCYFYLLFLCGKYHVLILISIVLKEDKIKYIYTHNKLKTINKNYHVTSVLMYVFYMFKS